MVGDNPLETHCRQLVARFLGCGRSAPLERREAFPGPRKPATQHPTPAAKQTQPPPMREIEFPHMYILFVKRKGGPNFRSRFDRRLLEKFTKNLYLSIKLKGNMSLPKRAYKNTWRYGLPEKPVFPPPREPHRGQRRNNAADPERQYRRFEFRP